MKKKIFSILLSLAMIVTMMPAMTMTAYAATYTITIDLNGGTLSTAAPDGWADIGDGKYTKAYPEGWADFGDEWVDSEPSKEGYEFAGWLPEGSYYTRPDVYLNGNKTVTAKYNALINVVVDPKGGAISAEAVPDGWELSAGGKYIKEYPEETSYYSILSEWENVAPTYSEASGIAFIEWNAKDNWYQVSTENYIIEAKVGELVDVTFDPDGGTVLSADSSWTLSGDGKYRKKYPKGINIYSINAEVKSAFKIAPRKGDYIFTDLVYSNSDVCVEDNTIYKPRFVMGYTITVVAPENGYILANGEKVISSKEYFVPSTISFSVDNGILTIAENDYGGLMDPIFIEAYGNSGYELDSYTISGEAITGYIYQIDGNKTISATFKSGTQKYPVWVDGNQFSANNLSMMEGKVSYNPETQTLTLDGANISSTKACAINFANSLTINVSSDSVLSSTGSTRCALAGIPYKDYFYSNDFGGSSANLNITGDGKLRVNYENSAVYGSFNSIGILAKNLTIDTDTDVLCGDMEAQGYYDATYIGIRAGNTIINSSKINIIAGRIYGMSLTQGFAIDGALVMNQADVKIDVQNVDTYSPDYYAKLVSDKLTLNTGRFSGKMNPVGRSVTLSQVAILKEIKGAQEGATSSNLQFTQASASASLVLSTKEPVSLTGLSMTKPEYVSGDAVECTGNPVVKKEDSTDVTSSIDGYIYNYYKKDGDNWIDIGSQPPTGRGTYKLIVEVDDEDYYGVQELPFTITTKHTVIFDTNGHGTAPQSISDVAYGSKISEPTAPSCDGYTFGGWYKDVSCNSQWIFDTDIVTADATLYAKWTINTYTINFAVSADGYGTVSQASSEAVYETTVEASGNTLKIGDIIVTATPTSSNAQYTYTFDNWSNVPSTISSDATITANFTRTLNKYDVTFDANGHGTAPQSISDVAYGSKIDEPTAPSCDGYTFGGWYKEAGCQNVWTFSSDAVQGDTILYAKWTKNQDPAPEPTPTEEYTVPVESENTVQVEATIESGKAAVKEITKEIIEEVTKPTAGKEKSDAIVIDLSKAKQDVTAVELTSKTVENLAEAVASKDNAVEKVTIQMAEATVELDAKTLETVSKEAKGDTIKLVVDKTKEESLKPSQKETLSKFDVNKTFEAYFESNGQRISSFNGGKVVVGIKFTPDAGKKAGNYKVYYVDDEGKIQKFASKYVNGMLKFSTTHFSDYAIVYEGTKDVLLLKAKISGSKVIKLSWNGIDNATKYVVYGAKCGNEYKKLKTTTAKSYTVKKIAGKKLKAHKAYKFYVVSYDALGNKVQSRSIHFVTANTQGKYANVKSIKAKYDELLLSVGVTQKIGAKYKMYSGKKHIKKSHGAALRYISNNTEVATVTKAGVVKAVGKGTATIYIQDIGGKYCKTKVTVE